MKTDFKKQQEHADKIRSEKLYQRVLAEKILFDNMSDYTAKHISEISFLSDWIVDAMIEYNEYMEEGIKKKKKKNKIKWQ